jgi:hypothetical protein
MIVLFLSVFFIFQFACAQAPGGSLAKAGGYAETEEIDPDTWDFGTVKPGAVLKHNFVFKNVTNNILKINNIHNSCGCTVSKSGKQSLLPQESTEIKVTFNSHGYSGPIIQFVYVDTDNPDLDIIKFTIKANVVKED